MQGKKRKEIYRKRHMTDWNKIHEFLQNPWSSFQMFRLWSHSNQAFQLQSLKGRIITYGIILITLFSKLLARCRLKSLKNCQDSLRNFFQYDLTPFLTRTIALTYIRRMEGYSRGLHAARVPRVYNDQSFVVFVRFEVLKAIIVSWHVTPSSMGDICRFRRNVKTPSSGQITLLPWRWSLHVLLKHW
jgi:hypothetical protein